MLYREKEQFADQVSNLISHLQSHSKELFSGQSAVEAECSLYNSYLTQDPCHPLLKKLMKSRKERRRQGRILPSEPGHAQPTRWYPVQNDPDLRELNMSQEDVHDFLIRVLGWSSIAVCSKLFLTKPRRPKQAYSIND